MSGEGAEQTQTDARFAAAVSAQQAGRADEAARLLREILQADPRHVGAQSQLGMLAAQQGKIADGLALIEAALKIDPRAAQAWLNHANVNAMAGNYEPALADYDRAIALAPTLADAHFNRGGLLAAMGRHEAAAESFALVIALAPRAAMAHFVQADALFALQRHEAAFAAYERALLLDGAYVPAWQKSGLALFALGKFEEALTRFDRAVALEPNLADAHQRRGAVLQMLGRSKEALESFDRAIGLSAPSADTLFSRGVALRHLTRHDEALESFDRAIVLKPNYAEAHLNRGGVLLALERWDEALAALGHAARLNPDLDYVLGELAYRKLQLCDWAGLDALEARILEEINAGDAAIQPWAALSLRTTLAQQQRVAENLVRRLYAAGAAGAEVKAPHGHDKIRIAYVSADFRDHAVGTIIADLIEAHDRARFEVTALSLCEPTQDATSQRLRRAFDRFVDVARHSDQHIAALARRLEIDIAIDLTGFTEGGRTRIFAHRAAPVQVNFLGYASTMGASYLDYIIGDDIVIPPEEIRDISEKLVSLPDTYQPPVSVRPAPDEAVDRETLGLPEDGFVFCAFHNAYKITPDAFAVWMRLLRSVDKSVLWLKVGNSRAEAALRQEAHTRGVAPDRLVFAGRAPLPEHLSRYRAADLFLDTFNYNAHATGSDALYFGLPLLTLRGKAYAGRVGASMLTAVGMPELITETQEEYEATALHLARNPDALAALRQRLSANRARAPLFDTQQFARHIEAAYIQMWTRSEAGLAPDHIKITAPLTPKG